MFLNVLENCAMKSNKKNKLKFLSKRYSYLSKCFKTSKKCFFLAKYLTLNLKKCRGNLFPNISREIPASYKSDSKCFRTSKNDLNVPKIFLNVLKNCAMKTNKKQT